MHDAWAPRGAASGPRGRGLGAGAWAYKGNAMYRARPMKGLALGMWGWYAWATI
jgi:hypothetical protein